MNEKKINSVVAGNIRTYRKQRGLTIERLAEKAGIDSGFLGHIETRTRVPSLPMLARLSAALDVAPCDLLVDPADAAPDALERRLQALFRNMKQAQKKDLLAILVQRNLGKELKALRGLLRA